jgi:hypothetical protein
MTSVSNGEVELSYLQSLGVWKRNPEPWLVWLVWLELTVLSVSRHASASAAALQFPLDSPRGPEQDAYQALS